MENTLLTNRSLFSNKFLSHIRKNDIISFLSGFFACLLTNIFLYTNTAFVHDSIQFFNNSTGIENGRFLLGLLYSLTDRLTVPWVIGILSCIFMGIIIVLITRVFNIDKTPVILLCAGVITTSTPLILANCYFSSAHLYLFALMLSLFAVFLFDKKLGWLWSCLLMTVSCCIYQAYISTAFTFLVGRLILDIQEGKFDSNKKIWKKFFKICLISMLSMALYYIIWKIVLVVFKSSILNYYAYQNVSAGNFNVVEIIGRCFASLLMSFKVMLGIDLNYSVLQITLHTVSFVIALILLFKKAKETKHTVLTALFTLVMLVGIEMMFIISGTISYKLVLFAQNIFYIIFFYYICKLDFSKLKVQKLLSQISCIVLVLLTCFQFIKANETYTNMKLSFDNAYSFATRVLDRIEQTEGFNPDTTKIVIVAENELLPIYKKNEEISKAFSKNPLHPTFEKTVAMTYPDAMKWFFENEMYMGNEIIVGNKDYIEKMENNNYFPAKDSVIYDKEKDEILVKIKSMSYKEKMKEINKLAGVDSNE